MPFTAQELAEMAAADAEIDAAPLSQEDYCASDLMDLDIQKSRLSSKQVLKAARERERYAANREKILEQKRAYRAANRERISAQRKAWYQANREKVSAQQKAYRDKKKEAAKK